VAVTASGTTSQSFVLDSGIVSGTVTANTTGNPVISGATIETSDGAYSAITGSGGTYSITMPPGTYTLLARKSGYGSAYTSVTA